MSHTLTYNSESHILEAKIQDEYMVSEAKQLLLETAKAVKEHNCYMILADVRDVKLNMSIVNLDDAPKFFSDTFSAFDTSVHQLRRAVVVAKETHDIKFLENVVTIRGQVMKLFLDVEEAKKWLLGQIR